jgi:hypothetical protein
MSLRGRPIAFVGRKWLRRMFFATCQTISFFLERGIVRVAAVWTHSEPRTEMNRGLASCCGSAMFRCLCAHRVNLDQYRTASPVRPSALIMSAGWAVLVLFTIEAFQPYIDTCHLLVFGRRLIAGVSRQRVVTVLSSTYAEDTDLWSDSLSTLSNR